MNENALAYGVDVGGTTIKLGLFDSYGSLLRRDSIPTDTGDHGAHILPQIARWIRRQDIPLSQLSGVGLGVPGPVRKDGTVNRCVNLGWGVVPVAEVLSGLLDGVPVRVANDANAAALGECWQGAGREMDSLLLVTLGTGVGGGLVLHGDVLAGAHGERWGNWAHDGESGRNAALFLAASGGAWSSTLPLAASCGWRRRLGCGWRALRT